MISLRQIPFEANQSRKSYRIALELMDTFFTISCHAICPRVIFFSGRDENPRIRLGGSGEPVSSIIASAENYFSAAAAC